MLFFFSKIFCLQVINPLNNKASNWLKILVTDLNFAGKYSYIKNQGSGAWPCAGLSLLKV